MRVIGAKSWPRGSACKYGYNKFSALMDPTPPPSPCTLIASSPSLSPTGQSPMPALANLLLPPSHEGSPLWSQEHTEGDPTNLLHNSPNPSDASPKEQIGHFDEATLIAAPMSQSLSTASIPPVLMPPAQPDSLLIFLDGAESESQALATGVADSIVTSGSTVSPTAWALVEPTRRRRSTTTATQIEKYRSPELNTCAPPAPPLEPQVSEIDGDYVDLYYDQKELFVRGWSRDAKQTHNLKGKKRIDHQIEKRRQQSMRDKALCGKQDECGDFGEA